MSRTHRVLWAAFALAAGTAPLHAAASSLLLAAAPEPPGLALEWDARLRAEQVDEAGFQRDAQAQTLRVRLGLRGTLGHGWSTLLEGAGVASSGERYNSGANGQLAYPAITDPRGSELNQFWLRWQDAQFAATAGRQRLTLDNQRWIGNSGWRQHEQTFDALALQWQPRTDLSVRYDWLDRVHRVAGRDARNPLARQRRLDSHLLNAAWVRGNQQWVGYAYLHEDRDVPTASSASYGVRWTGKALRDGSGPGWVAEVARQRDYANSPLHFGHSYWLLEPAWTHAGITARIGWEHLGGNGRHALQTPLAGLHPFNGWDDQFAVTPPGGLEDRYADIGGTLKAGAARKLAWTLTWHDYRADHGGRYGSECNASLGLPLASGLSVLFKLANYHANGYSRDNTKAWLQLEWSGERSL